MLLAAASVLFVLLCALDSFVGNQVTVPVWWLLGDAALGMLAISFPDCLNCLRRQYGSRRLTLEDA